MVGESRTAGHGKPSCVLLPRTNGSSCDGLWGWRGCVICSRRASAFFLYDPVYSFYVSSVHALGELFWFLVIALLGVKCLVELRRQSRKPDRPWPRSPFSLEN